MKQAVHLLAHFAGALLASSGFYVTLAGPWAPAQRFVALLHVLAGAALLVPLVRSVWLHVARRGASALGVAAGVALGGCALSGALMVLGALREAGAPALLGLLHLVAAVATVALSAAHVVRALRHRTRMARAGRMSLPWLAATAAGLALAFAAGLWLQDKARAHPPAGYAEPYGEGPFFPARVEVAGEAFVNPIRLAGSASCGACHAEIYRQWSESMHRYAATDEHVAIGSTWFERDNGVAAGRFCAGCHNPIALVAGAVDEGSRAAARGTPPHDEGVSCLACHSIEAVHRDPVGNAGYSLRVPRHANAGGPLDEALTRMDLRSHARATLRRPLYQSSEYCGACHQQYFPEVFGGPGPRELHHQLHEWAESRFAQPGPDFESCQDCHMPLVEAEDPAAVDGKVHSHRFPGANHAQAVKAGHAEQAEAVLALLRRGVELEVAAARAGDAVELAVTVRNAEVGHDFPSGTTDISEAWLEITAGAQAAPIFTSGLLDARHYLDPGATSWRTIYLDENHLPVDLHDLAAVRRTLFERRIEAGASETARYAIPLAGWDAARPMPVRVRLRLRRANQRWNDWLFNFDGRTVPVTDIHTRELTLDLRTLAPAEAAAAQAASTAAAPRAPAAPEGMVYVPKGPTVIGSDEGDPDERPAHTVEVGAFFIDRHPVTNARYQHFVRATRAAGPRLELPWAERFNWTGDAFPPGAGERPVLLVTQGEAAAYCAWAGGRLPREVEWVRAARGGDGRRYPWGERLEDGACAATAEMDVPERVGLCPQRASRWGVEDLVGGVFEWTADPYRAYAREHLHPNANEWIVTFGDPAFVVRGVPAGQLGPSTAAWARVGHAEDMRARIGLRCVRPVGDAG